MKTRSMMLSGVIVLLVSVAVSAAVFGIQSVAALTDATSTEPVVAEVVSEVSEAGPETGSETAEAVVESIEPTSTSTTEDAAVSETPSGEPADALPTEAAAPQGGTGADREAAMSDISALEETYFAEKGSYLQILRGNGLPTYESGTVAEKFGKNISSDAWVYVYEAPAGKGYQVFYEDNGVLHSVGYGPEARERTFSRSFGSMPSATSTSATL